MVWPAVVVVAEVGPAVVVTGASVLPSMGLQSE